MGWQSNGGDPGSNDTNTPRGNGPYGGNGNRNSPTTDDQAGSSNAPFSGYGIKKGAFKPQFAKDSVNPGEINSRQRMRGGRMGQGGFARIFKNNSGKPDVGAAGSGPSGALSGIFGR